MLTINKWDIHLTRGDTAYIKPIPEVEKEDTPGVWELYELQEGDRIVFRLAVNSKVVLEKECEIDVENNKATLTLIPEDTENLEPRAYNYCFELITVADAHFTFIENARFDLGKEIEKHGS